MKIGIFGGTFNPIHTGHLLAAQSVREKCLIDRMLFIPAATSPFKAGNPCASAEDRMEMVRLAIEGDDGAEACPIEIERGGMSYAIDTARAVRAAYPGATIHYIVGADCVAGLYHWRCAIDLLNETVFTIMTRPGTDLPACDADWRLPAPWPERLRAQSVAARTCDISSSEIRRRVADGRSIRNLVPRAVEEYILGRGLYREG